MPKSLNSKPIEAEAESVPSSLRIVCDDAATITLAAVEVPEEGKAALRKFSMTAYTGGAMRLGCEAEAREGAAARSPRRN